MKRYGVLCLLLGGLLLAAGCEVEDSDTGQGAGDNNGEADAGNNGQEDQGGQPDAEDQGAPAPDMAHQDAEPLDLGDPDQGAEDLMIDQGEDAPDPADVGPGDVSLEDMDPIDGGPVDGGPADLDPGDVALDGGPADVGPEDVGPEDVGPGDLGPVDVGFDGGDPDVPPVDMGVDGGDPDVHPDLPPVDMGEPDVAMDAGQDGGMDAGEPDLPPSLCPPQGPYGNNVGDTIPDVQLPDCDGQMRSLHDLCEHQVGWIFEFAAWCPPCRTFARTVNALYLSFDREDVGAFVVISQNNNFGAPNAAFCQDIKRQYGLTDIPVLYDPDGRLQRALNVPSNDINILTRQGGEIFFKRQYSSSQVEGAIEDELMAR